MFKQNISKFPINKMTKYFHVAKEQDKLGTDYYFLAVRKRIFHPFIRYQPVCASCRKTADTFIVGTLNGMHYIFCDRDCAANYKVK